MFQSIDVHNSENLDPGLVTEVVSGILVELILYVTGEMYV
jgi:hypothetical protein